MGSVVTILVLVVVLRLRLRKDRREEQESVAGQMARLVELQGKELSRLSGEELALHHQLEVLASGRFHLQEALDAIREQLVASRVLIHDYERRLGLPETALPPMPLPTVHRAPGALLNGF